MNALAKPCSRIWASPQDYLEDGPMLGRKVANISFITALLEADPYDGYHFFLSGAGACAAFNTWAGDHFPSLLRRGAVRVFERRHLHAELAKTRYHCMHLPDALALYTPLIQARNAFALTLFPVTGLTHSLSYAHFMSAFLDHMWPGVTRRDGIIVTSNCARAVLERAYGLLRRNYGLKASDFPSPSLFHIPLGVGGHSMPGPDDRHDARGGDAAAAMRRRLNIGDEPVFLCFSRFSHQSKMDLMPLFAAFIRAEAFGLPRNGYSLILAGWADEDDQLPEALCAMAQKMGIRARLLPRPTGQEKRELYAAADIFVSPADNIQETFGLAVAEAALAGLPAIVSDFDGYRDIVINGETGLLIPTLGYALSDESDVLAQIWFDNQYHLKLAQETAISVPALGRALAQLGTNPALRRSMGEAARKRARDLYVWGRVLERWVDLWDNLAQIPLGAEEEKQARQTRHPRLMRFAEIFAGHFTATLGKPECGATDGDVPGAENTASAKPCSGSDAGIEAAFSGFAKNLVFIRTAMGEAVYRGALPLVRYAGMESMLDPEAVRLLLLAARKPLPVAEALARLGKHFAARGPAFAAADRAAFTLLWAVKQDCLEALPPTP